MKRFFPGLRTEILLSLTVLLVSAMILTSFVVTRIWERDLLRYKAADGKALIQRIQAVIDELETDDQTLSLDVIRTRLAQIADHMVPWGLFDQIVIRAKGGEVWLGKETSLPSGQEQGVSFSTAWGMERGAYRVTRTQRLLAVTSPLFLGDQRVAVIQVPVRIDNVLKGLRRSQQFIWFYIGLNVLVLLLFGTFLLSRIVIRPIRRLVKTAEHFEDGEEPLSFRTETEHNEMAHLAMSLNRMLKRLAENKHQMEAQIQSLEEANQELKEAREVVLRSEKLSSLGRLAAGVAHEVGNPIGAILGYTDLVMGRVEDDPEAKDYLTRIESEISRINTIVRELLDFSRSSPSDPSPVHINAIVSEAVSFFSRQKRMESVELQTHLEEGAGLVWADADQLKQVLINLLFNACDALEGTGRIAIHTRRRLRPHTKTSPHRQAEGIDICVSDTGPGIPPADRERIFDPFFTTKPPGKGTGLGLAISRRIVESFGGSLEVESTEVRGSTFAIRLNLWEPHNDTQQSHHRPERHQA